MKKEHRRNEAIMGMKKQVSTQADVNLQLVSAMPTGDPSHI